MKGLTIVIAALTIVTVSTVMTKDDLQTSKQISMHETVR